MWSVLVPPTPASGTGSFVCVFSQNN
jgi:hypothetical protein